MVPSTNGMVHGFGHDMSRSHARGRMIGSLDLVFFCPDGSTDAWGYDFRGAGKSVLPTTGDLVSYSRARDRISDYGFTKALNFHLADEGSTRVSITAKTNMSAGTSNLALMIWVGAPAVLPDGDEYSSVACFASVRLVWRGPSEHHTLGPRRGASTASKQTIEREGTEIIDHWIISLPGRQTPQGTGAPRVESEA